VDPGHTPSSIVGDRVPVWQPPPVARLGPPVEPPPLPLPPALPPRRAARRRSDNERLAWTVALFTAACAAISYVERPPAVTAGGPGPLERIAAADGPLPGAAGDAGGDWPDPLVALYETRADAARPVKLRFSVIDPHRAASRAKPPKPPPIGRVADAEPIRRPQRWPSRPATLPPPQTAPPARSRAEVAAATRAVPPRGPRALAPAPASAAVEPATPRSAPHPAPDRARLLVAAARPPGEEERIRTTLARFGSAYSRLDAGAARAVWPSVDVRALERAFDSLKSQDLRFDGCSFTVEGARARAACTGRAVYVPRIGNQSPRSTSREWTFELRKADEEWTIASARSS
jgi:hypothetical protein